MKAEINLNRRSRRLAFLLRHDTGYAFDEHGWRDTRDLVANHGFTMDLLEEIVATNDKQRYEFNVDKTKIRARQGHSVKVDVELQEAIPPMVLYHGTAVDSLAAIMTEGLRPGERLHVHLSADAETAMKVGSRHGDPIVLQINATQMVQDGVTFYISNNSVWLTKYVSPNYISPIKKL